MAVADFNRSIPEVLADAMNQFTTLVRKESQLARAEMSEKLGDLALGIGLLVGGAVLLIPALVILLEAAVNALIDAGIGATWATLIVGVRRARHGWGFVGTRHRTAASRAPGAGTHDRAITARR